MKRLYVFALIAAFVGHAHATLSDLEPPDWRTVPPGQAPTTYQGWSFSTADNPAVADVVENDFGNPTLGIVGGNYLQSFNNRDGIWRFTTIGSINIYVPNTGNDAPGTWKEIWLQLIYSDPAGSGSNVPLSTDPGYDSVQRVISQPLGNDYLLDVYKIIIVPNPPGQEIVTFSIQCALYVDEIVVDTICIPEPATISLLAFGVMPLLRKRKR